MNQKNDLYDIEEFIPHRDRLKLIDRIIAVDANEALTESVVRSTWPLAEKEGVDPIVIIELIAQTAGATIGWTEKYGKKRSGPAEKGWLVGVKSAEFLTGCIPIGAIVQTRSSVKTTIGNYKEITGSVSLDSTIIGSVDLQVMKAG